MRLVGERLQRICHPHEIVPTLEGVSRRMPRAAVGVQARDVEPGQPSLLEGALEFGVQERAVGLLAQHDVAGLGCESRTISAFQLPAMACGGHFRSSLSPGVWASVAYTTVTPARRAAASRRPRGAMRRWARCW